MALKRRGQSGRSIAQQRAENGGYSDAELDQALLHSQRSDPLGVSIRLLSVCVAYGFLASAVARGMSSFLLLLPLMIEFLLVMWLGLILGRTLIDCAAFRRSGGRGVGVVLWTLGIFAALLLAHAYDGAGQRWELAQLGARLQRSGQQALQFGVHWAVLAMTAGLVINTTLEVLAWRRQRGVFVWTSITSIGTRIGLLILLAMVAALPLAWLGKQVSWYGPAAHPLTQGYAAWPLWALLLVLDLGVVIVLALMHRDLLRKRAPAMAG